MQGHGSIGVRVLAALLLAALVPAGLVGGLALYVGQQNARRQVMEQLDSVARFSEHDIEVWVADLQSDVAGVLSDPDAVDDARTLLREGRDQGEAASRLAEHFRAFIDQTIHLDELFLLDDRGKVLASSDPGALGGFRGLQDYARLGLEGPVTTVQTLSFAAGAEGAGTVVAARPLKDPDGDVLGVVAGRASLDYLDGLMAQRTGLGRTGETLLVDANRILLTASRFEGYAPGGAYLDSPAMTQALDQGLSGSGEYADYRGVPVVGVWRHIPSLNVALVAKKDRAEAFEPMAELRRMLILALIAGGALACVAAMWLSRGLTRPLVQLSRTAARIAGGELDLVADIHRQDEIGVLAGAFNSMTRRLRRVIKDLERQVTELDYRSLHDPLTDLANRTLCLDRVRGVLSRTKRRDGQCAVIFLDLDRFKVINDSMGHALGDRLLVETARRLEASVREGDTVARFGGDEFVIVLEDLGSHRETIKVVRRIRQEMRRPFELGDKAVAVTASMGLVLGPMDYDRPEDLLQHANIAMHQAKRAGRDRFVAFTSRMLESAVQRMALESDLDKALERGELFLNYQPIMRVPIGHGAGHDGERREGAPLGLYGFEALVRWRHPGLGLAPPSRFIPVAEETGAIMELGLWVLETAAANLAVWRRQTRAEDLVISVNLSARHFSQPNLVDKVGQILAATGLPPEGLKLEITETAVMDNAPRAVEILTSLRRLGVTLSMDDFGAGYSSMSYLQKLPLDNLKIDLSFVQMMDVAPENVEIVRAIINLSHTLGLEVVAEGVERPEHERLLVGMGCEYLQGYLYAKPMDAQGATEFVRTKALGKGRDSHAKAV